MFIVEEIVQDILQRAGDIVYKHHIQRRVVPYAVVRAKADILAVVEVCCIFALWCVMQRVCAWYAMLLEGR